VTRQPRHDLLILGKAVREIRAQHGLSASDLARASGVALERLVALEDGRLDPDMALLFKLADGMSVGTSVFFRRAEELDADVGEES